MFLVIDKSGRSAKPYNLSEEHLRKRWDLKETDHNTEITLEEYLDNCNIGSKWRTNSIEIICCK